MSLKVLGGAYVVTIGLDIFGNIKEKNIIKLSDIKDAIFADQSQNHNLVKMPTVLGSPKFNWTKVVQKDRNEIDQLKKFLKDDFLLDCTHSSIDTDKDLVSLVDNNGIEITLKIKDEEIFLKKGDELLHTFKPLKNKNSQTDVYYHLRDLVWSGHPRYDIKDYENHIKEYFLTDEVDKTHFDEFLVRLFARRSRLLRGEIREGFITIKIFDQILNLYTLKPCQNGIDERVIVKIGTTNDDITHTSKISPCPELLSKSVRIRAYFHMSTSRSKNKHQEDDYASVARVGTITMLVEPKEPEKPIEELSMDQFFNLAESLYVDLSSLYGILDYGSEIKAMSKHFLKRVNIGNKEHLLVSLYDFSVTLSWVLIIRKVRSHIENNPKINKYANYKERHLDSKRFLESLHHLENDVSFNSRVVRITNYQDIYKQPLDEFNDADPRWLESVAYLMGMFKVNLRGSEPEDDHHKRIGICELKQKGVIVAEEQYLFNNKLFVVNFADVFEESKYHFDALEHILDSEESGSRWYMSWNMMIGELLCQTKENFVIYKEEILKQSARGETERLERSVKKAIEDFSVYYETEIIQNYQLKRLYSKAKETFGINQEYNELKGKMDFFSDFEIAETNAKLQRGSIIIGAAILGLTLIVGMVVPLSLNDGKYNMEWICASIGLYVAIIGGLYTFRQRMHEFRHRRD